MLFSPITIGKNLTLQNRIAMPPMCMYVAEEGQVNDFHLTHYAARSMGGVGLIIVEATGVEPCGRITNNCLGIYEDAQVAGLKELVSKVKAYGSRVGIQLGHAGRKCVADVPAIYAPSPLAYSDKYKTPTEMTAEDIKRVVHAFGEAGRRAEEAGFDLVEIHGAHGYLLHTFLSPLTNQRTDGYGGSPAHRVRILREVIQAVKAQFNGVIAVRVSAEDFGAGGNTSIAVAELLNLVKDEGIELVNVSSGGAVPVDQPYFPGFQVPYAQTIKEATGLPVIAGGLLTQPIQMDEIIRNERADLVFVGRELLRNPFFVLKAAHELGHEVKWPYGQTARSYM